MLKKTSIGSIGGPKKRIGSAESNGTSIGSIGGPKKEIGSAESNSKGRTEAEEQAIVASLNAGGEEESLKGLHRIGIEWSYRISISQRHEGLRRIETKWPLGIFSDEEDSHEGLYRVGIEWSYGISIFLREEPYQIEIEIEGPFCEEGPYHGIEIKCYHGIKSEINTEECPIVEGP